MSSTATIISHNPLLMTDTLLAVTQILEQETYKTMLYVGSVFGFIGLLYSSLSSGKGHTVKTYILVFFLLLMGVNIRMDVAIFDPTTGTVRVVEKAPGLLVLAGWSTSAIGNGFRELMGTFLTTPDGSDVLAKDGVGKGLAILTGMQKIPWTDNSRNAGSDTGKFSDLEASITNYLADCYAYQVEQERLGASAFAVFHYKGNTSSILTMWDALKAPYITTTRIKINADSATSPPTLTSCESAHTSIRALLATTEFQTALVDDAITNMTRKIAALTLPGAGVNGETGVGISERMKLQLGADAKSVINALFGTGSYTTSLPKILFLEKINEITLQAYKALPQAFHPEMEGRLASAWSDAKEQNNLSMAAEGDFFTRHAKGFTMLLEGMVFAFIPVFIFMMFVSQKGMTGFMGVVGILLWLQSWPVAYVLINHYTIHTVIAQLEPLLADTSRLGMLDMYGVFEQARQSYATSQFMLGMTPVITGTLLSGGSLMMLTKLAGNLSSKESLDEKRVHRDTEDSSPIHGTEANQRVHYNSDGSAYQAQGTRGDEKSINLQSMAGESVKSAESRVNETTEQRQVAYQNLLQHAVNEGDMKTVTELAGQSSDFNKTFSQGISTTWSNMDSTKQQNLLDSTFSTKAEAGIALEALRKVGIGAGASLTESESDALSALVSKDESLQKSVQESAQSSDSWKVDKSGSVTSTRGDAKSQALSRAYNSSVSEADKASKQHERAETFAEQASVNQTLNEGAISRHMAAIMHDLEGQAALGETDEEKMQLMEERLIKKYGASKETANITAKELMSGNYLNLKNTDTMRYGGVNGGALALYDMIDKNTQGVDELGAESLIVNEFASGSYSTRSDIGNDAQRKTDSKFAEDAPGDPELSNKVDQRTAGAKKIEFPTGWKNEDLHKKYIKQGRSAVDEGREAQEEYRRRQAEMALAKKEKDKPVATGLGVPDGDIKYGMSQPDFVSAQAAYSENVDPNFGNMDSDLTADNQYQVKNKIGSEKSGLEAQHALLLAVRETGASLKDFEATQVDTKSSGAEIAYGLSTEKRDAFYQELQAAGDDVDQQMAVMDKYEAQSDGNYKDLLAVGGLVQLLGEERKSQFDAQIQGAAGNVDKQIEIVAAAKEELQSAGIPVDAELLIDMQERIDSSGDINEVDVLERIGNYFVGDRDSDQDAETVETLKSAMASYGASDLGRLTSDQLNAEAVYSVKMNQAGADGGQPGMIETRVALVMAAGEIAYSQGQSGDYTAFVEHLNQPANQAVLGSEEKFEAAFEQFMGENSYEDYRSKLPDAVVEDYDNRIADLIQNEAEEIKHTETMQTTSPKTSTHFELMPEAAPEAPAEPVVAEAAPEAPAEPVVAEAAPEVPAEPVVAESASEAPAEPMVAENTLEPAADTPQDRTQNGNPTDPDQPILG